MKQPVSFHRERSSRSSGLQRLGVPLTQDQGVCGSGIHCHARPAPVPIRCAQARPLDARATAALAYRPCYLRNCIGLLVRTLVRSEEEEGG